MPYFFRRLWAISPVQLQEAATIIQLSKRHRQLYIRRIFSVIDICWKFQRRRRGEHKYRTFSIQTNVSQTCSKLEIFCISRKDGYPMRAAKGLLLISLNMSLNIPNGSIREKSTPLCTYLCISLNILYMCQNVESQKNRLCLHKYFILCFMHILVQSLNADISFNGVLFFINQNFGVREKNVIWNYRLYERTNRSFFII